MPTPKSTTVFLSTFFAILIAILISTPPKPATATTTSVPEAPLGNVTAIDGEDSSCVLMNDGTVKCWGSRYPSAFSLFPVTITGVSNAISISGSSSTSCALIQDGRIQCWGWNPHGQLGNGTMEDFVVPTFVLGISDAVAVSIGNFSTCAVLADGRVQCWGGNFYGQLGDGTETNSLVPVTVSGISNAIDISVGGGYACALLTDGTIKCWGQNETGQLGNGFRNNSTIPVAVFGITNAKAIEMGYSTACAILDDNSLKCWGGNSNGQLGDGTYDESTIPHAVSGVINVKDIGIGLGHVCAIISGGIVKCWGGNWTGQLGDGSETYSMSPVSVTGISNAIAVSAGIQHTCALLSDGTVKCWGDNLSGGLGNSSTRQSNTPIFVMGTELTVSYSTGSSGSSFVLKGENYPANTIVDVVLSWPYEPHTKIATITTDINGQFALNMHTDVGAPIGRYAIHTTHEQNENQVSLTALFTLETNAPTQTIPANEIGNDSIQLPYTIPFPDIPLENVVAIDAGNGHTCAVINDGSITCWGSNDRGQLGDGNQDYGNPLPIPTTVYGITNAIAVSASNAFTCALLNDSTVKCWGQNQVGQLGHETSRSYSTLPLTVSGIDNAVAITTGLMHSCALLSNKQIKCWGYNENGQFGDGGYVANSPHIISTQPIYVPNISNAISISSGLVHTCALLDDGRIKCWGSNDRGQLGNEETINESSTPVYVTDISNAVGISIDLNHSCGILVDATVKCWGEHWRNEEPSTATTISGISDVIGIGSNYSHACVLLRNNRINCWGEGENGQLGNGFALDSDTPILVNDITNATAITVGHFHSCALLDTGHVKCWGNNSSKQLAINTTGINLYNYPFLSLPSITANPIFIGQSFPDDPYVQISKVQDGTENNEGSTIPVKFKISVDFLGETSAEVSGTINYSWSPAERGEDYDVGPETFTIPNGETDIIITVPVLEDAVFERPETIQVRIYNVSDVNVYLESAVAFINSDDDPYFYYFPIVGKVD